MTPEELTKDASLWNDAYLMEEASRGPDAFPSIEHWNVILAEVHARGLATAAVTFPEIESYLRDRGLDAERAASALRGLAAARRESGRTNMRRGALWCIGGTVVTVFTYLSASPGETYTIAWGAILFGAIQFFKGIAAATVPGLDTPSPETTVRPAAQAEEPEPATEANTDPSRPATIAKIFVALLILYCIGRAIWIVVREAW